LNPSDALDGTNQRFIQRLSLMENFADKPLQDYTLGELEMLWRKAKSKLNH
jgi:XTP/dITP diphosphohydrolase